MTAAKTFSAHGKFLLTAEYLVLYGATALAIPLRMGQDLKVTIRREQNQGKIFWTAYQQENIWFEANYDIKNHKVIQSNDIDKVAFLEKLLNAAHQLNPVVLDINNSYYAETRLNFHPEWGLGSSSTLVSNVARWFEVSPYDLHFAVSNGSGYDIACATASTPIFYTLSQKNLPQIEPVDFYPPFVDQLFFVYSGRKQRSEKSVRQHQFKTSGLAAEILQASRLSKSMAQATTLHEFEEIVNEHNQMMSHVLQKPMPAETILRDFPGTVKWLGAWGGDFILATWRYGVAELINYLKSRSFDTVFAFQQMVDYNNVSEKNRA
jgi:mevalonate kinase